MKFEIRNRWTGEVQFSCELSAEVAGLIERLRYEANISDRPGQLDRLNAIADELADALEAARVEAWQPIETCPSDDRVVMFCDERNNIWTDVACNKSVDCTGFPPTYWRELPAPPALGQRGEGE